MSIPSRLSPANVAPTDSSSPSISAGRGQLPRRQFVATVAAGMAGSTWLAGAGWGQRLQAAEPITSIESDSFRPQLAVAAYTFRRQFRWMKGKPQQPSGKPLDMRGFIDFCAAHDVAAELTSYFFPGDIDEQGLRELRRYAFLKGVTICGTAIGNHFDTASAETLKTEVADAKRWIDRAAVMGAPHVRFFAGTASGLADPQRFEQSVAATRECAAYAASRGVMIGIENHGGITPETLMQFLDQVDHPWVGINLDTGNFYSATPYADLEACVERAIHVQWKAAVRDENRQKSPADYKKIADILRKAHYAGFIALEYEEDEEPYTATTEHLQRIREALQG